MWYFSWVLGVGFAGAFSILNAMWLELQESAPEQKPGSQNRNSR
jgi:cytochrome bd-I ubiquinol oxidase subunit X